MSLLEELRFASVYANWIYRSAAPRGGEDLYQVHRAGIDVIIDLREGWGRLFGTGFDAKTEWEGRFQKRCLQVSFSNFLPPTVDEAQLILEEIERAFYSGKRVLIHCRRGRDRTGFFSALVGWRFFGRTPEGAWRNAKVNGMHWIYQWAWRRAFERACLTISAGQS